MITHVNNVVVYVTDQDRALDFYVGKLGFEKRTDAEMSPGRRWLEVLPPGAQTGVALLKGEDFERDQQAALAPLTFSCDDAQKTYEQLHARGVEVSEPVTEPWNTYLRLTDPDGHVLIVGQRRS